MCIYASWYGARFVSHPCWNAFTRVVETFAPGGYFVAVKFIYTQGKVTIIFFFSFSGLKLYI